MNYFPLFLNLKKAPVLVVGGGKIAFRKVELLLQAGADVLVLSPELDPSLQTLLSQNKIRYLNKVFEDTDIQIQSTKLVITATDEPAVNHQVSQRATQCNIWVNAVDSIEDSTAVVPAIVDRSPIQIAISSSATSPTLARLIRLKIESLFSAQLGLLAQFAQKNRSLVKDHCAQNERRTFWESVLTGQIAQLVLGGQEEKAQEQLESALQNKQKKSIGMVFIVGAGPGHPDLLTLRALQLMQSADIVLYDHLVSDEVLSLVRRDAQRISVAKIKTQTVYSQEQINQMMVQLAQEGKKVVRLKGGDPAIFGRLTEELKALTQAHIPFEIVPGISAANGAAAYAGVPLTDSNMSQSILFISAHEKNSHLNLDFSYLSKQNQTLVIYMGLSSATELAQGLITHHMPVQTPCAVISRATCTNQQVLVSTLAQLEQDLVKTQMVSPVLIIVGNVAALAQEFQWFNVNTI
ncbi:siroheme synthase CysG [Neisseria sp. Ec49-e6-T10]|uniref:siroheme synthase CysG n=1 Tax=Neisseria sp. Ec49-e6-T10 TaxID=3140744 RepID=UPI003EBDE27B